MDIITYALAKKQAVKEVPDLVDGWLEENVDPSTGYVLDNTLSLDNAAPPASAVGDLKTALSDYLEVVYYDGNPNQNAIILTKDDIAEPSFNYSFTVPDSAATYLEIFDTNNTRITYIGKGSSASGGQLAFSGTYTIPENFGSIKFVTTSSTPQATHVLLNNPSKQEEINSTLSKQIEDIDFVNVSESYNLFTQENITAGTYIANDGTVQTSATALVSDFIPVSGGDTIRCTKYSTQAGQTLQVYDSSKAHIRHYNYTEEDESTCWKAVLPSNAAYIRLNVYYRDMGQIVIVANRAYDSSLAGENGKYISLKNGYIYNGPLVGKKIAYNGDSICEGRYAGTSGNGGGYANLISRKTSSAYENRAISGGILASEVPAGQTDPNRKVVSDIENMAEDADIVCIEGGYNDYAKNVPLGTITAESDLTGTVDTSTICGALESIFRQAQTRWLGKPIVFVIVHKVQGSYYTENDAGYTFKDVHDACVNICNKYAIPYYDACLESGLNGHNAVQSAEYLTSNDSGTSDGTHPNEEGYKRYYVPQLISLFESVLPID